MTNSKILQEYGGGSRHKEPEKRVEVKARLRGTGPGKEYGGLGVLNQR